MAGLHLGSLQDSQPLDTAAGDCTLILKTLAVDGSQTHMTAVPAERGMMLAPLPPLEMHSRSLVSSCGLAWRLTAEQPADC